MITDMDPTKILICLAIIVVLGIATKIVKGAVKICLLVGIVAVAGHMFGVF